MSKGYIAIAQNSGESDYIKMAYALALSIKSTQSEVSNFAVCVTDPSSVPTEYLHAFDHVIQIPWDDHAKNSNWKIENKWKYYYMTPFEETVILDCDMVFLSDVSYWWGILSNKDVWFTTNVRTFKNEIVTSDFYRKTFTSNDLPNVYTAFFYFKKSTMASEIFKLTEIIYQNWERFYYDFLDETRPKHVSGDVCFALAVKILGIENECTSNLESMPTFVHMKSFVQNIPNKMLSEIWTEHIPTYFTYDGQLKVNNFAQILPFHYHRKEWLSDDIIAKLEGKLDGIRRRNENSG